MRNVQVPAETLLNEDGQDLAAILALAIIRLGGSAIFTEEEFEDELVLGFDLQYMREHPGAVRLIARREKDVSDHNS